MILSINPFLGIVAVHAIVGVNPGEIVGRTDQLARHPFVLTVVGQRDASTRGWRGEQQFVGIWPGVGVTQSSWLVGRPIEPSVRQLQGHTWGQYCSNL